MGISPTNLFTNQPVNTNFLRPFANTAEISRGAVQSPSPDPLTPSTTAFGTNANPAVGGPFFTSSAAVLNNNVAGSTNNVVNSTNSLANSLELQQAINTVTAQAQANDVRNAQLQNEAISRERSRIETQPLQTGQNAINGVNTTEFTPAITTTNLATTAPGLPNPDVSLFGRNAAPVNQQFAATNNGLGVSLSEEARKAIAAYNAAVAADMYRTPDMSRIIDGRMPFTPILFTEFRYGESLTIGNVFKNKVVETFNDIMKGGGNGSQGSLLARTQRETEERERELGQQAAPKGLNFIV